MHLSLRSVTKTFGSTPALDSVSLDIEPGQIIAVLGANGAGKTTLLRSLAGVVAPETGEIRFDAELFQRDRVDLRKRLFLLPDFPLVYSEMTVLRHVGLVLRAYEAAVPGIEERVIELLREFDVLPLVDAWIGTLSRGETYKVALAALLAVDPEVWMLDEPFASGMDPRGLSAFRRRALDAAQRGRTVIFTTQILELAEAFADQACILHRGRVHAASLSLGFWLVARTMYRRGIVDVARTAPSQGQLLLKWLEMTERQVVYNRERRRRNGWFWFLRSGRPAS